MIKITATTLRVVRRSVVSIAPNAPKKSAKIPPPPVTLICKFSTSFPDSLIESTIAGNAGSPPGSGSDIFSFDKSTLASIAFPSSEGIGIILLLGTK